MRKGEFVSRQQLDRAARAVQAEFLTLGLWSNKSRLLKTDIVWCYLPQVIAADALGFCFHNQVPVPLQWLGYKAGNIYIPQWVLSQGPWGQDRGSLRDLLRHEYAHALAWHYPGSIRRSRLFVAAFGGSYNDPTPVAQPKSAFVSEYARTRPAEDFAETFKEWVRRSGRLPVNQWHPHLRRKWTFVGMLVQALARSG